ncbi:MAG: DUF5702 domain-containing protein [Bacillota bacterium]|nr:DUF5702 domain-containing protein [Bacillota bacterium]
MIQKKKGSVSFFLVIVIPIILVAGLKLYDCLFLRYQDEKALKIVSAVSEAHLSRYNAYLKQEYRLVAGLEMGTMPESLELYMDANGYRSTASASSLTLDRPRIFRDAVVKSAMHLAAKGVYDELLKKIGVDGLQKKLTKKLDQIERKMEVVANLIEIPEEIEKMTKTRDISMLKEHIRNLNGNIAVRDGEFDKCKAEILDGLEKFEELRASVRETLLQAERKYRDITAEAMRYAREVEEYLVEIEEHFNCAERCFQEIERLESVLKTEGISPEAVKEAEERIEALTEQMAEADRKHAIAKAELDKLLQREGAKVSRGAFSKLVGKIKKGLKRLKDIFDAPVREEEMLDVQEFVIDTPFESDSFLEKIAIVEWCVQVMSCYRKDGSIDHRAFTGELEYIISGQPFGAAALSEVRVQIAELRAVPNLITFFRTDFKKELDAFLSPISDPFGWIAKTIAYGISVLAESYQDVSVLIEGGKVPLLKSEKDWGLHSDDFLQGRQSKLKMNQEGLEYKDYLRVLVFLQREEDIILRSMHLVNASVEKSSGGKYGLKDFSVGHALCVEYRSQSLFTQRKSLIRYENAYD